MIFDSQLTPPPPQVPLETCKGVNTSIRIFRQGVSEESRSKISMWRHRLSLSFLGTFFPTPPLLIPHFLCRQNFFWGSFFRFDKVKMKKWYGGQNCNALHNCKIKYFLLVRSTLVFFSWELYLLHLQQCYKDNYIQ